MEFEDDIQPLHLATLLAERALAARHLPKRKRTRMSLLAATAAEMEAKGYSGLTIDAVVERAGVARGTFYLYFANRAAAAIAVNRAFSAAMRGLRPRGGRRWPAEVSIYRMNLFYVRSYAANASLLQGREVLMRDRPELARARDFVNQRWARAVLRDFCLRTDTSLTLLDDTGALLTLRAVIAMADELLRETYVFGSPKLQAMVGREEDLAEALSFVWYRAIFGQQPKHLRPLLPQTEDKARHSDAPAFAGRGHALAVSGD